MKHNGLGCCGACLVLALLLLSAGMVDAAVNVGYVTGYRVNYNTAAETVYTDNTIARSFSSAQAQCMANGLNLFSGESTTRMQRVYTLVLATYGSAVDYSTYTSISAAKTATNNMCIYTNTDLNAAIAGKPNPFACYFTIQWGLFTVKTMEPAYGSQPGVNLCQGVFKLYTDGNVQSQPGPYETGFVWDTRSVNPIGQNYTIINTGATQAGAVFANVAATVPTDFYLSPALFTTACEAQVSNVDPAQTFNATQPSFIKGYKDLTWVQKHWWVLFLIIAVVILIVLFAILIYCCLTSLPPKEGPPIAPMVLRERNGQAYVNASDDDDTTPKSRDLQLGDVSQNSNEVSGGGGMDNRQGSGLMMPMMAAPMVDPEDLIQATPSIYSQDDVMQTAENDSLASDDEDSLLSEDEESEERHH